jgi:hypothetical protein
MHISIECRWIVLDLLDTEASARVNRGTGGVQASPKRPLDTTNAIGVGLIPNRVRERDPWWPR